GLLRFGATRALLEQLEANGLVDHQGNVWALQPPAVLVAHDKPLALQHLEDRTQPPKGIRNLCASSYSETPAAAVDVGLSFFTVASASVGTSASQAARERRRGNEWPEAAAACPPAEPTESAPRPPARPARPRPARSRCRGLRTSAADRPPCDGHLELVAR